MNLSRAGVPYRALRRVRNSVIRRSKRLHMVHPTAYIHQSSHVARDLRAEEFVFIGRDCTIGPRVCIGRYTMLASDVAVVGDDHNWDESGVPMQFSGRPPQRITLIGRDVWIGHGVILLRGARVGNGAIIAAGAVVTRDVPAYEIWAGVPAKKVRDRFSDPDAAYMHEQMLSGAVVPANFAAPRERFFCDGRSSQSPEI